MVFILIKNRITLIWGCQRGLQAPERDFGEALAVIAGGRSLWVGRARVLLGRTSLSKIDRLNGTEEIDSLEHLSKIG